MQQVQQAQVKWASARVDAEGAAADWRPLSRPQRLHMALHSSDVSTSCLLLRRPGPEHL